MRGIATGGSRGPAGANGADGVGVPVGGTSGQVLAKNSNTDFDTGWVDMATPSPGGAGEYFYGKKLLYDNTLTADGNFDVPNIPQDFDHLEILIDGRGAITEQNNYVNLFFNGDTTVTNYRTVNHRAGGANHNSTVYNSSNFGLTTGSSATANEYGSVRGFIQNYANTNKNKQATYNSIVRFATDEENWSGGVDWQSTAAINRIQINYASGTFKAGSRLQIFGLGNRQTTQGVTSAYVGEQLSHQVVGTGGQASLSLTGIPSGYDRIEVHVTGKVEGSGGINGFLLSLNGDTTNANYRRGYMLGGGTTNNGSDDSRYISGIPDSSSANNVGTLQLVLPDYSSSTSHKSVIIHGRARQGDLVNVYEYGEFWENNTPVNQITLVSSSGAEFAEGTVFTVVGYRNSLIKPAPKTSLLANGEFETGIDGWSATSPATISYDSVNKSLLVSRSGAAIDVVMAYTTFSATIGRLYNVSLIFTSATNAAGVYIIQNGVETQMQRITAIPTAVSFIVRAIAATVYLVIKPTDSTSATTRIDNVYVVEL